MSKINSNILKPNQNEINAIKLNVSSIGVIGGLISIEHGFFETLQGNTPTNGIIINAIAPNQGYWEDGGELAMTLIPNFLITGIVAMIIGLLVILWSLKYVDKKGGGLGLLFLQILQLLFGGGIAFFILGVIISFTAFEINKPLNFWKRYLSGKFGFFISKIWKKGLIISVILFSITVLGGIFGVPFLTTNDAIPFLTNLGLFSLIFMLFTIIFGFAHKIQNNFKLTPLTIDSQ